MPYIGKPQSADPITVNSSNITDGTIVNADLSSSLTASISGAFTETSSSLALRLTDATGSINNISSSNSTRTTTLETASSSLASDVVTLKGGGTLQSVATNASPTFVGATITGTLTAQEIHTEFESASIIFSSGSTIFGDTSDDIHRMTGSLNVSGALNLNDGDAVFGATATVETGLNLESGTFTVKNATSDSNGLKISQGGSDASNILNHYNGTLNLGVANSVDMTLKGGNVGIGTNNPEDLLHIKGNTAAVSDTQLVLESKFEGYGAGINFTSRTSDGGTNVSMAKITADAENSFNTTTNTQDAGLRFFTTADGTSTERMRINSSGNVGIGTNNPDALLQVSGSGLNGAPTLAIDNTSTSAYIHSIEALGGAMTANQINIINLGKIGSTKNSGIIGYKWVSAGSDDNLLTLEHWGTGPLVVLDGAGKMGIGTTTMDAHVNINSGATNAGLHVESTDSNANISMADNAGSVVIAAAGNEFIVETGGSASTAGSGASERFRIDSSGNVGIGTNNPGNPLHLYSDTYPQLSIDGTDNSGNIGFVLSGSGGRGGLRWNGSNNDVELLREGGGVALSLKDGAGVLISADVSGDYGCFINNSNATGWGLRIAGGADSGDYIIRGQNEGGTDKFVVKSNGSATINQGADDGEILTFKSSDVAHGVTARTETDTYGFIKKGRTDEGGVFLGGYTELDIGITLDATSTSDITDKNTGANGNILVRARKKDGTGDGQIGSNANLMVIENYDVTRFIFDAEGDFHADNTVNATAFDTYNDAQLVRAFDLSHGKGVIQSKFDEFVNYQHETLAELGLVGREDDGTPNHFINITGMQRLHNGAIWQQYTEMEKIKELMYDTIVQLLGKETADKKLEQHDIKLLDDSVDGTDNIWSRLKNKTKSLFKIIK